jgi:Rrf2 family protein
LPNDFLPKGKFTGETRLQHSRPLAIADLKRQSSRAFGENFGFTDCVEIEHSIKHDQLSGIYPAAGDCGSMKLSRKSDYALRALFSLVAYRGQGPVSIRVLAEQNDIPRRFLEQIMLDLKSRGWVESIAGRDGGFVLAKKPEEITMGEIVRHFDGILAPISCVSTSHYEACSQEGVCRFRRVMLDIRNYIARLMDEATLSTVFAGSIVRREEVFSPELNYGDGI